VGRRLGTADDIERTLGTVLGAKEAEMPRLEFSLGLSLGRVELLGTRFGTIDGVELTLGTVLGSKGGDMV
jgi:hypothetical protein